MARIRRDAGGGLALVTEQNLKLIHEREAKRRLLCVSHLLFVMPEVRASAGERRAADTAVVAGLVLVAGRTEMIVVSLT